MSYNFGFRSNQKSHVLDSNKGNQNFYQEEDENNFFSEINMDNYLMSGRGKHISPPSVQDVDKSDTDTARAPY